MLAVACEQICFLQLHVNSTLRSMSVVEMSARPNHHWVSSPAVHVSTEYAIAAVWYPNTDAEYADVFT